MANVVEEVELTPTKNQLFTVGENQPRCRPPSIPSCRDRIIAWIQQTKEELLTNI
jgi:hypothetical protein